jgi:hypothetical protein
MIRAIISDRSGVRTATVPTWAVGLGAFGFAALGLALFVIGAGLALILAPVAIGALLIARWRLRTMLRQLAEQAGMATVRREPPSDPNVIDGEFRVVDPGRP